MEQMNTGLRTQPENLEYVGNPGCSQEPDNQGPLRNVPHNQGNEFSYRVYWIFQPLFPFYIAVKASNARINYFLSVLENVVSQLKKLLFSVESVKDESLVDDDLVTLTDSMIESLYGIWFIAYKNVRESVDYIEAIYEEIVPLIPDEDPPFAGEDKDSMTIREMCLHATEHMCSRLCYHMKQFFQNLLDRH